jgi:hypothetical protein
VQYLFSGHSEIIDLIGDRIHVDGDSVFICRGKAFDI